MNFPRWRGVIGTASQRLARLANDLTIATRLGLSFGLVLTLFAGTTIFAIAKMSAIERDMDSAISAQTDIANRARLMRKCLDDTFTVILLQGLASHPEDINFYRELSDKKRVAYFDAKKALLSMSHDGADIPGFDKTMNALKEAEAVLSSVDQLVKQHVAQAAAAPPGEVPTVDLPMVNHIATNMKNEFDFWGQTVDTIVEATAVLSQERQTRARMTASLARTVEIVASVAALLVGVLAAWLIARNVARPIRRSVQVAERISDGDLSLEIPLGGKDETGALTNALSRMQSSLNALVAEVRDTASSIEVASREVAAGNRDLSQRTEHTAARLQSTTGSVTQLLGAVRQSAESAQTADGLARGAAEAAAHGGEIVAQVVQNMHEIAANSGKMSEIIGAIDGIAFQTNILALNAAVEAAHAGEQGRGFIVVANEVRVLAQRSASAAKDIKDLINASGRSIELGDQLVREAGQNMERIVASSRKVTVAIEEISLAMATQSAGIDEVDGAMRDVDRMTQQNSALVEQSAAATESLVAQSQRLSQAVAVFRLGPIASTEPV